MPRHLGLHHLALRVREIAAAAHFYVDLLGYTVEWQPDPQTLYLTSGNDNLALHQHSGKPGPVRALDHFGILVADPKDVLVWEQHLRDAGVSVLHPSKTHRDGATSCTVLDPDGTALQILHHPPIVDALVRSRALGRVVPMQGSKP